MINNLDYLFQNVLAESKASQKHSLNPSNRVFKITQDAIK